MARRRQQRVDSGPNARELRSFVHRMQQLLVSRHRTDYEIGRMVCLCMSGRYWRWWPWRDKAGQARVGYKSFGDWCWAVLGFKQGKADNLKANYRRLSEIGLDESGDTFSRAMRIGWSKLYHILRAARDEATLCRWLDRVEDDNLTYMELIALVKWALAETLTPEATTPSDQEAPEAPEFRQAPNHAVRVAWRVTFDSRDAQKVVLKAHGAIQHRFGHDIGLGKALSMMATHYLATRPRDDEGGAPVEVELMISALETNYRLRVIALENPESDDCAKVVAPGRRTTPRGRRRR